VRTPQIGDHDSSTRSLIRCRIHSTVHYGPVDQVQLFTRLFAAAPRPFWLDGAEFGEGQARFSYLGDDTGPLAEFCRYDAENGVVEVHRVGHPVERVREDIFTHLRRGLADRTFASPALPFGFTCGYVGYKNGTDTGWLFADRVVVIDQERHTTHVLCLAEDSPDQEAEAIGWLDATIESIESLPAHGFHPAESTIDNAAPLRTA
jgi:para-aminobenzoate synthetase